MRIEDWGLSPLNIKNLQTKKTFSQSSSIQTGTKTYHLKGINRYKKPPFFIQIKQLFLRFFSKTGYSPYKIRMLFPKTELNKFASSSFPEIPHFDKQIQHFIKTSKRFYWNVKTIFKIAKTNYDKQNERLIGKFLLYPIKH